MDTLPPQSGQPYFEEGVAAGFPSPVMGEVNSLLDLNALCVRHPATTYYVRARGESMTGAGIDDGDILVVDRSLQANSGDIVIAAIDGEFTVKRLRHYRGMIQLVPENPAFATRTLTPHEQSELFGVVTWILKQAK